MLYIIFSTPAFRRKKVGNISPAATFHSPDYSNLYSLSGLLKREKLIIYRGLMATIGNNE